MRPTDYDQGCTHTDDPELEKIKEAIFAQFVRLHSHSASSNTAVFERICPNSESTTRQPQESSRGASVGSSTLLMQISTVATAQKDPYPKACYSTRRPAQFISNPHCSVEASTPVPPGPNSKSSRPGKLSLPLIHKWIPSATGSDHSSGETTHTQDPPTELKSSGGELTSSYSPLSTAQSDCGERLIRSAEHATVAETSSSQASCTTTQGKAHHFSSAVSIMHTHRYFFSMLT